MCTYEIKDGGEVWKKIEIYFFVKTRGILGFRVFLNRLKRERGLKN